MCYFIHLLLFCVFTFVSFVSNFKKVVSFCGVVIMKWKTIEFDPDRVFSQLKEKKKRKKRKKERKIMSGQQPRVDHQEEAAKKKLLQHNKEEVMKQLDALISHTEKKLKDRIIYHSKDKDGEKNQKAEGCQEPGCNQEFGVFRGVSRKHCHICARSYCADHLKLKKLKVMGVVPLVLELKTCKDCRRNLLSDPVLEIFDTTADLNEYLAILRGKRTKLLGQSPFMSSADVDAFWKDITILQNKINKTNFEFMMDSIIGKVAEFVEDTSDDTSDFIAKVADIDPDEYDLAALPGGQLIAEVAQMLPSPFNAPLAVISGIFKLISMTVMCRSASYDLGKRLASLTPAIVELNKRYQKDPDPIVIKIVDDIREICEEACMLIKEFVPTRAELNGDFVNTFCSWFRRCTKSALLNPAERFEDLNKKISDATNAFVFARAVQESGHNPKDAKSPDLIAEKMVEEGKKIQKVVQSSNDKLAHEIRSRLDAFVASLETDLKKIKDLVEQNLKIAQNIDANVVKLQQDMNHLFNLVRENFAVSPGSPVHPGFDNMDIDVWYKGAALNIDEWTEIGRGRCGIVYAIKGRHDLVAKCLIPIPSPPANASQKQQDEFQAQVADQAESIVYEARLMFLQQHGGGAKHIVKFFGLYNPPNTSKLFLIMERCLCSADEFILKLEGKLGGSHMFPIVARLYIANCIATELKRMHHDQPYPTIFGDLKLKNILIRNDGTPVLADFGSSKREHPSSPKVKAKFVFGRNPSSTVSPELLADPSSLTTASDVYSFGVMLFELVSSSRLTSSSFTAAHLQHRSGLDKVCADELLAVIRSCVESQPINRCAMRDVCNRFQSLFSRCNIDLQDGLTAMAELIGIPDQRPRLSPWLAKFLREHTCVVAEAELTKIQNAGISRDGFLNLRTAAMKSIGLSNTTISTLKKLLRVASKELLPAAQSGVHVHIDTSKRLGSGVTSSVYEASFKDRQVAAKIFRVELWSTLESSVRRELTTSPNLRHPNIVAISATIVDAVDPTLVSGFIMEKMGPRDLAKSVRAAAPSILQRLKWLRDAASGILFAHSQKIIHCDIKPENILISSFGIAKLTDFGCSHVMRTKLVVTGSLGTVLFTAPEYGDPDLLKEDFAGCGFSKVPNTSTDVFAFGMTMWMVFHPRADWAADLDLPENYTELQISRRLERGRRPKFTASDLPDAVKAIIEQSWDANPAKRPTMKTIAAVLDAEIKRLDPRRHPYVGATSPSSAAAVAIGPPPTPTGPLDHPDNKWVPCDDCPFYWNEHKKCLYYPDSDMYLPHGSIEWVDEIEEK